MKVYKDWLGKEIKVGSKIVYPGRQSSSLWMNLAEVLEIIPFDNTPYWLKKKIDAGEELTKFDKIALENFEKRAFKLKVRSQHTSWVSGMTEPREVTITAVSRVTVVD